MLQVMVTIDPICSIENDVIVNISSINGSAGIAIVDDLFGSLNDPIFLQRVEMISLKCPRC